MTNAQARATTLKHGIVRSANTGWGDPVTVGALAVGIVLIAMFVLGQHRVAAPILPLRLFSSRQRAGAYASGFCSTARCSASSFS
jgi:hypothetical protein